MEHALTTLLALLVYEWIITLGSEVNLFWKRKISLATCLFLFIRYLPLVLRVFSYVSEPLSTSEKVSQNGHRDDDYD